MDWKSILTAVVWMPACCPLAAQHGGVYEGVCQMVPVSVWGRGRLQAPRARVEQDTGSAGNGGWEPEAAD